MKVNTCPGWRVVLRKAPLAEVTLCGIESLLVQVTVPPTATVTDDGLNALPASDTAAVAGAGGAAPPPPLGPVATVPTVTVPCIAGSSLWRSST